MRRLIALVPVAVLLSLAACGGSGSTITTTPTEPTPPITTGGSNVATITVGPGPLAPDTISSNTPFVSVTVCAPGSTTNCQTIDNIQVDTGSAGLRILSSVLSSSIGVVQETNINGDGGPVVECTIFADGISWGPVVTANVQVGGETAASIPIQVIGDPAFPTPPNSCLALGPTEEDSVATFGANGILGVGPFVQDGQDYYSCPEGACSPITVSVQEVTNPVASFPVDSNGVIVELPGLDGGVATSPTGSLVFGIGTQSNNALGTATIYALDPVFDAYITVDFNGTSYPDSFIDSGSNSIDFVDSSIPVCSTSGIAPNFFCPSSTMANLTAMNTGSNGVTGTAMFSVANAEDLFNNNPTATAFLELAGPSPFATSFDWGLPFFFGKNVFTAIAGDATPGGPGPYVAY
jgi:hypothetical protein